MSYCVIGPPVSGNDSSLHCCVVSNYVNYRYHYVLWYYILNVLITGVSKSGVRVN